MAIYTVTELTRYIKDLLARDQILRNVYVRGEIANFHRHFSGHCYFSLKDGASVIKAVLFRRQAQRLKFDPRDGLKVIAGGMVTVYERDGQYQLYVERLIPEGLGEISLALAQLKERLAAEGLFDQARKRGLPLLPHVVGVITSPTGAAVRDIFSVAKRRHPGVGLALYPVKVQGDDAPIQIVRAVAALNSLPMVDVIIVGRGGGAIEELWAFNDERVVRAVAASTKPIVSAVGHETDFTLTDFAADVRAPTPSAAAEMAVPDTARLRETVRTLRLSLEKAMRRQLREQRQRLARCADSAVLARPQRLVQERRQAADRLYQDLVETIRRLLGAKTQRLQMQAEKLSALSPLTVLSRGYSIINKADGTVVRTVAQVRRGETVTLILRQGRLFGTITGGEEE